MEPVQRRRLVITTSASRNRKNRSANGHRAASAKRDLTSFSVKRRDGTSFSVGRRMTLNAEDEKLFLLTADQLMHYFKLGNYPSIVVPSFPTMEWVYSLVQHSHVPMMSRYLEQQSLIHALNSIVSKAISAPATTIVAACDEIGDQIGQQLEMAAGELMGLCKAVGTSLFEMLFIETAKWTHAFDRSMRIFVHEVHDERPFNETPFAWFSEQMTSLLGGLGPIEFVDSGRFQLLKHLDMSAVRSFYQEGQQRLDVIYADAKARHEVLAQYIYIWVYTFKLCSRSIIADMSSADSRMNVKRLVKHMVAERVTTHIGAQMVVAAESDCNHCSHVFCRCVAFQHRQTPKGIEVINAIPYAYGGMHAVMMAVHRRPPWHRSGTSLIGGDYEEGMCLIGWLKGLLKRLRIPINATAVSHCFTDGSLVFYLEITLSTLQGLFNTDVYALREQFNGEQHSEYFDTSGLVLNSLLLFGEGSYVVAPSRDIVPELSADENLMRIRKSFFSMVSPGHDLNAFKDQRVIVRNQESIDAVQLFNAPSFLYFNNRRVKLEKVEAIAARRAAKKAERKFAKRAARRAARYAREFAVKKAISVLDGDM